MINIREILVNCEHLCLCVFKPREKVTHSAITVLNLKAVETLITLSVKFITSFHSITLKLVFYDWFAGESHWWKVVEKNQ